MAFVADYNDEELQRALDAQAGRASGPVGAPPPAGPPTGGAPPISGGPSPVPGTGAGTGFVNLSRYFDANAGGAERQANALMDPLKKDGTAAGDAAANAVPEVAAPTYTDYVDPRTQGPEGPMVGDSSATDNANYEAGKNANDTANAHTRSDYEAALAKHQTDQEQARQDAISRNAGDNLKAGSDIVNSPTRRNEAMSKDGQNPSAFDSYLTGSAIGGAYDNLRSYYGATGRTNPVPTPDPFDPQPSKRPGAGPAPRTGRPTWVPGKKIGGW